MPPSDERDDLVRDALQVYVNEAADAVDGGGWVVAHYIAAIGLYRVDDNGVPETRAVVTSPSAQADYIDHGLLQIASELLAERYEDALEGDE